MRPRGMRSKWVRLLPWYYTERRQPTRSAERDAAINEDVTATCGPGMTYGAVLAAYSALSTAPMEPIYLTRLQFAWLKLQIPTSRDHGRWPAPGAHNPLLGTPIYLVDDVAESTPHLKGWSGWPEWNREALAVGASVAPPTEETESD